MEICFQRIKRMAANRACRAGSPNPAFRVDPRDSRVKPFFNPESAKIAEDAEETENGFFSRGSRG